MTVPTARRAGSMTAMPGVPTPDAARTQARAVAAFGLVLAGDEWAAATALTALPGRDLARVRAAAATLERLAAPLLDRDQLKTKEHDAVNETHTHAWADDGYGRYCLTCPAEEPSRAVWGPPVSLADVTNPPPA